MDGVPRPTIQRLFSYYRYLKNRMEKGEESVICSYKLAEGVGTSSAQVRKDLSYFGEFGRKGVGYDIEGLKNSLGKILGINTSRDIALVGAGNLGRALVNYQAFKNIGLEIVEVFDCDLGKIGNRVGEITVRSDKELEEIVRKKSIKIAIMAIPEDDAQEMAGRMISAGIKAIWNFAPVVLKVPDNIVVYYEDLASSVVTLIYWLKEASAEKIPLNR